MLPDGYYIERDPDTLTLRRADGSVVARFTVRGSEWSEVERAAEEDAIRELLNTSPATYTSQDEPTS